MTDTDTSADRDAICTIKARYCRFLDARDFAAWRTLMTEDFVLDMSEAGGPGPIVRGRDEVAAFVAASVAGAISAHQVHFPEIEFEGEEAHAIFAMQDRVIWPDGRALTGFGHYHERYVRGDGGDWRLAASKLTRLHVDYSGDWSVV